MGRRSKTMRGSLIQRMISQAEKTSLKEALRLVKQDGPDKVTSKSTIEEEKAKHRSQVIPNRADLRGKKIGTGRGMSTPFSRMRSGARPAQASLYRLIAIRQERADGTTRTMIVPREMVDDARK